MWRTYERQKNDHYSLHLIIASCSFMSTFPYRSPLVASLQLQMNGDRVVGGQSS